jgi:hypothetical protein
VISVKPNGSEGMPVGHGGGNPVSLAIGIGVGVSVLMAIIVGVFARMRRRKKEKMTIECEETTDCEMDSHQYQSDDLNSDDMQAAQQLDFNVE